MAGVLLVVTALIPICTIDTQVSAAKTMSPARIVSHDAEQDGSSRQSGARPAGPGT